jgi:two-component system, NarL family, response regulator LiaR
MADPIRIMLVDDHSQVHRALGLLQETNTDLVLVAHASNGSEAVQLCHEHRPDVIIMDVIMPVMNGIEATRIIHENYPGIKVLALSSFQDDQSVREMVMAGAVGYILKNSSLAELANSIRAASGGTSVFSAEVTQALFAPKSETHKPKEDFGLTERELEILSGMIKGYNNKQIAQQLIISEPTVKFHVRNILAKLRASGRTEAVAIAVDKNLIDRTGP